MERESEVVCWLGGESEVAEGYLDDSKGWDPGKARDLIAGLLTQVHKQRVLVELAKMTGSEFDLSKLLSIIVSKSTEVVEADRSTLFLVDRKRKILWTEIAEGLENSNTPKFEIPLTKGIAGHVATAGVQVIINDAYDDERFDRATDMRTGYRTNNILATPMISSTGEILGVLQVINKLKGSFTKEDADFLLAFASSAAVHLETAHLYREIETMFDSFINMVAHAVDERDPCTAGHSRRVKIYSRTIGEEINRCKSGIFANNHFTEDSLRQLEIAALLHDVGKIGVHEAVLNKSARLSEKELQIVVQRIDLELSKRKVQKIQSGTDLDPQEVTEVNNAIEFIKKVSKSGFLSEEDGKRLWVIKERGWLDDCEYEHLAVTRGNLTSEEWDHMQSHVTKSFQLLSRIPWPPKLRNVPEIAYCHHEKLNGKGYPRGLSADQIPLESQIVTVADIYDALTAHDRPYKPPMSHERASSILIDQAAGGLINQELVDLFLNSELYRVTNSKMSD